MNNEIQLRKNQVMEFAHQLMHKDADYWLKRTIRRKEGITRRMLHHLSFIGRVLLEIRQIQTEMIIGINSVQVTISINNKPIATETMHLKDYVEIGIRDLLEADRLKNRISDSIFQQSSDQN